MRRKLEEDLPEFFSHATADDIPVGWLGIVRTLAVQLPAKDYISQIKEKFGGLRVYYHIRDVVDPTLPVDVTIAWEAAIRQAEKAASKTCEDCGKPGTMISPGGWLRISCEEHVKGA